MSISWRSPYLGFFICLASALLSGRAAISQTTPKRLAVLELKGKIDGDVLDAFADAVRGGAVEGLAGREVQVMTRENMMALLKEMGRRDCSEGDCEVETARNIGADFVVSGGVVRVDSTYVVTLKLHETKGGSLLATKQVEGRTKLEVLRQLREHGRNLVAKNIGAHPAAPPAAPAGAAATPSAVCSKDADCPAGSVCNQGVCAAPHLTRPAPGPAPGDTAKTVPVRFSLPSAGGSFAVRSTETNEQCPVPCALQLRPGLQRIEVGGEESFSANLVVPNEGGEFRLRSGFSPRFYWGLGVAVVGATLLGVGLYGEASCPGPCSTGKDGPLNRATAGAFTGAGAIGVATGAILMLFYKKLELAPTSSPTAATPRNHTPQFGLAPTRNGSAMAMSMQF